jgi:hypothetical protein
LYLQQSDGKFTQATSQPWLKNTSSDVLGALFFDADSDHDADLYIATGGSEFLAGDPNYIDHLYLNDGHGGYTLSGGLPSIYSSTKSSCSGRLG